jgi:hypothetical protein
MDELIQHQHTQTKDKIRVYCLPALGPLREEKINAYFPASLPELLQQLYKIESLKKPLRACAAQFENLVLFFVHSDDLHSNGLDIRQNAMLTLLGWEAYGWAVAIWFENGIAVDAPANLEVMKLFEMLQIETNAF